MKAGTVPHTPSAQCLVRISDASNTSINDISDNVFTIVAAITVTTPNGGENWLGNSQQNITWTSQNITNVSIEYSTNNGSSWTSVISSTPASGGSYSWTVPNIGPTQCLVRTSDASNASINDVSDATFTISAPNPLLTPTVPNGGEIWAIGSVRSIKWNRRDVLNIKIEYSTDNVSEWLEVVDSIPAGGTRTYAWTIPNTPSTQCRVRISEVGNPSVNDVSNNTFTIQDAVSVDDSKSGIPEEYDLYQCYPNPFNPSTTIQFSIPEATDVSLNIYNSLGQKVAQLVDSKLEAGIYSYQWDAGDIATGMYIYELRTNNFVSMKR